MKYHSDINNIHFKFILITLFILRNLLTKIITFWNNIFINNAIPQAALLKVKLILLIFMLILVYAKMFKSNFKK